jgi:hypothetical protein
MKWISIKEEMPPDGRAVMLCIEINYSVGYIYTSGAFVGGRWKLNESHNLLDTDCYEYEDSYADDITHWMPLPQPPSSSNSDYAKCLQRFCDLLDDDDCFDWHGDISGFIEKYKKHFA